MKPSERKTIEIALRKAEETAAALRKLLEDNPKPEKQITYRKYSAFDMQAARYLDATLQVNIRGYKKQKDDRLEIWAEDFRKLREIDGYPEEDIINVMKWTVKHHFWKMNVRSGSTFREKYETLLAQMQVPERVNDRPTL